MLRSACFAFVVMIVGPVAYPAVVAAATPALSRCAQATVLVHDMGSNEGAWSAIESDLADAGRCSFSLSYGSNAVTAVAGIAGLTAVEDSAAVFGSFVDSVRTQTGLRSVDVIAHGAGGLVVQYYLDSPKLSRTDGAPAVASLTTLGPLWGGTDIAGLSTLADVNKRLGIYEALAKLEAPLLTPICPGCPQLIAHSALMTKLDRGGYRTPGVRYTDIITIDDLLMSDPMSAALHGVNSVLLQDIDPANRVNHFALPDDPLARRLAVDASTPP